MLRSVCLLAFVTAASAFLAPRAPAPRAWETPSLASVAEAKAERDAPTSRHELVRAWVNSQFQGRVAHSRARPAKQKVAPATAMSGR